MKHFSLPKDGGLIEQGLPKDILHSYEKIPVKIYEDADDASKAIADEIVKAVKNHSGNPFKLGLTTGNSPISLYLELIKRYKAGEISFKDVEFYSIDEYYPISREHLQSRYSKIKADFLNHIDAKEENIHVPDGTIPEDKISDWCAEFDKMATGIDYLVIGFGTSGQIGFNEAGSPEKSRTRTVYMSNKTRWKQSKNFGRDVHNTPMGALTMGIATMMSAKKIVLMGWGEDKAAAVQKIAEGPIDPTIPATYLQKHENVVLYTDENSAANICRVVAPWLVGPCDWTPKFVRKAVVWLCEQVHKPILKLTFQDYVEHNLASLLEARGAYDQINIKVFNELQHTITGWPGGKPNADDSTRPVSSSPFPKRVVIFSPHPDDDVISMGGTFIRLAEQGHDVHVAYQTSGNVAVHDDVVLQHMDTAHELGFADEFERVKAIVASKKPGEPEPRELLNLKGAIRRAEARSAVRSFGLNDNTNAHFLNLPFYETGGIKKGERTQADIDIIIELLQKVQPHQIYLAGDLADPHGTHRVCTEAVLEAIEQLKGEAWMSECHVWLYRGAWMEWEIGKVDMAVPLSPDEVIKKRHAIYRHLSQKDIVPFPGDDSREFWQRAEERTQNTARLYDELGMAEYQAIEVFVKLF